MGAILTTAATMKCPHGGTIVATVAGSRRATAGAQILTVNDTYMIAGCPFVLGTAPHPCVIVQWTVPSLKAAADHGALLTVDSQGMCLAADAAPQGPPILAPAQTKASAL